MSQLKQSELPKDLSGYQHVENGPVLRGDIWVNEGRPSSFVDTNFWASAEEANQEVPGWSVYRKLAVPKNEDDKDFSKIMSKVASFKSTIASATFIPQDDTQRKHAPMFRGLLGYFPAALFAVAAHSYESDQKHNPGSTDGPTWARNKSSDHADCIIRHMIDAGMGGTDEEIYHLTAQAWRSLAQLQEALEKRGAKPGISSRF